MRRNQWPAWVGIRTLLTKDRSILERELMEFRPFGLDEHGHTIRDLSGMSIRATVLYLEKTLAETRGEAAGREAVQELCELLNQRIKDPVYHVTPEFLRNAWNSYSYEFAAYLYEFCERLSGDPRFMFNSGAEKASPILQVLARPFSLEQIYGMFPYFSNKFASGSIESRVIEITPVSATLAMRFSDSTLRQFGSYRRRCAHLACQSAQGILAAVPVRVHGLPPARLTELACIADDADWCRWLIHWQPEKDSVLRRKVRRIVARQVESLSPGMSTEPKRDEACKAGTAVPAVSGQAPPRRLLWLVSGWLAGAGLAAGVWLVNPSVGPGEAVLAVLTPVLIAGVLINRRLWRDSRSREALIQEQISFVEARHEELREAYLEQEQTRVQLRRKVAHLTALHRAGLLFSSTLDRETLLQQVLETLTNDLHYDRAMVSFFDPAGGIIEHARVRGLSPDVQAFAQSCRIPVTDPESPEGTVVLQGRPLLIEDVRAVRPQLHPMNRTLVELSQAKALIIVPLKAKDRIVGTLTVDRVQHGLTQDDLELMATLGNQVAIALDNASAYRQIEEWNAGLELKVRERTAALEQADRLRTQFLSHVSHELKTPLTSIKGFLQNLLDGLTGPLNDKQQRYLSRMLDNSDRLIRMIDDLLDRTSIEAGRVELRPAEIDVTACLADVVEQLRPLAHARRQRLEVWDKSSALTAWGDRDRMIQVIVNLTQNAIKYTPDEGVITVAAEPAGTRMVRIVVRDTGPGIPSDCLDRVFDPFFRVPQRQRSGPKGLGLGLSIVKTLVELQGGAVSARNHPDGGAEFSFTLPVLTQTAPLYSRSDGSAAKILVVDDDADIRQLLIDRLQAQGYRPRPAADGRQALEILAAEQFGGAIVDIGIGHIDGLEVLTHIRRRYPDMPVIMITASGSQELAVRAIGMGAQAYVLKPFEAGELQQAVHTWFRLEESVSERRRYREADGQD
ncbi:ATP-binding protein [Nitrospira moscoviensis]|uniref:ATP-binding response regulator n=1 Tax=Nitrospira moscoviensis TaxID=42253 RepID=UPI00165132E9|nr:ATP-binding protein [Nitrospira moscoviensis]